jgi:hypothetical protein
MRRAWLRLTKLNFSIPTLLVMLLIGLTACAGSGLIGQWDAGFWDAAKFSD